MQPDIIIFGGDHLYVSPMHASQGADRRTQPKFVLSRRKLLTMISRPQIIDHGAHLQNLLASVSHGKTFLRTVDRDPQSLDLDWLQQIVDGVRLERAHCEMIEGGREYDARMPVRRESIEDIEACSIAHLDVEQYDVGLRRGDLFDRIATTAR